MSANFPENFIACAAVLCAEAGNLSPDDEEILTTFVIPESFRIGGRGFLTYLDKGFRSD